MDFNTYFQQHRQHIDNILSAVIPHSDDYLRRLHEAMAYVVLNGGKRLRPLLVYATGTVFTVNPSQLDLVAAAIELIHAYSLVHDDLPAMDDDDLRRGKPTCHKAYDEATAILVGDGLQALAFQILTEATTLSESIRLKMLRLLTHVAGSLGMVGGQALDLHAEQHPPSLAELEYIYRLKTGALLVVSVQLSVLAAGYDEHTFEFKQLTNFAECIGFAFQIHDDILDIEGATQIIGKQQGADAARNKTTYPVLVGIAAAKERVHALYAEALHHLTQLPACFDTTRLVELVNYMQSRNF